MQANLEWLRDVGVYEVGRLPAHSDHIAQAPDDKPGHSSLRQSLNGSWRFRYSERPEERPADFYEEDYDSSDWDSITVPGHIQMQGYGVPQYVNTTYPWDGHEKLFPPEVPEHNPVGSYILKFTPARRGMRARVSFQGVDNAFFVWMNGELLGYSEDSCTPAEFDVTGLLRDGENTLAVEVYRFSTASWLEDQDFFRFSGIFRDVYLEFLPELHVEDIHVITDVDDGFESAVLRAKLRMSGAAEGGKVYAALAAGCGRPAGEAEAEVEDGECRFEIPVENVELWSAEDPNLYMLTLIVSDMNGVTEKVRQPVGFRRFEMVDKIMTLNGKRIVFNGTNRHDFDASCGRAATDGHRRRDLVTMKRNNINAVRTSHYPNGSGLYRMTDELGLYVIDETNLETHGTWGYPVGTREDRAASLVPGSKLEWLPACLDRARSMFERDKNHPSVLIWSCGNESFGGEVIYRMSEYFRSVDATRLVHYEGVVHDPEWLKTTDIYSQMYAHPDNIVGYLESDPERPYILCEYMHSMGNSTGGMKHYTELAEKYPMYQGGFIWDFIDQAVVTESESGRVRLGYGGDNGERPHDGTFSGNGIVFADGAETPKLQDVKHLYSNVKIIPDEKGVTIKNKNLFISTDRYAAKWTLKRNGVEEAFGSFEQSVAPGEEEYYLLPVTAEGEGEFTLDVSLTLRAATEWAEAGYEIAHGEHVWGSYVPEERAGEARAVLGREWMGVDVGEAHTMFSINGGLEGFYANGHEYLKDKVRPTFWRAMLDNDLGAKNRMTQAFWQSATQNGGIFTFFGRGDAPAFDEKNASVSYGYTLSMPMRALSASSFEERMKILMEERITARIEYRAEGGKLHCALIWDGKEGLPEIPNFALRFKLPCTLDRVRFYGMGPEENYIDRAEGARLGRYEYDVCDNLTPYLHPQECGNRIGVRWAEVTDESGHGLRFEMEDAPFEFGALHYSSEQLEAADHIDELPEPEYTFVTVSARQQGVGGQDSWMSRPFAPYLTPSDKPMTLRFTVEAI